VRLVAHPGEGISSLARIEWDIDGDGAPDLEGREVTARRGDVSRVTMTIDDPITRERISITRVIVEDGAPQERTK
jgi:hypothetical protein